MPIYYIYSLRLPLTIRPTFTVIPSNSGYNKMTDNKQMNDGVKMAKGDIPSTHASPIHNNPGVNIEPPINNLEEEDDDPLAWDRCAVCRTRGHYQHMFHCDDCEEAFHPGCLARRSPRNHGDPRFTSFTCKQCLDRARRAKRSRHE